MYVEPLRLLWCWYMLLYGEKLNVVDADEFCTEGSIEYTGLCAFPDSEVNLMYQSATTA